MGQIQSSKRLAKFISYILGRRPDEFGLVPNSDGYVKIKELLKAICEEDGWKYVRQSHINEILYTMPDPLIEIRDNHIRAKSRERLPGIIQAENLPKLLYAGIRRRAYPVVLDKGIFPGSNKHVVLTSDRDLAERIGRRIDQTPVILTVLVQKSIERGVAFYQAGDLIYLTDEVTPDCFTGPSLPKQKPEPFKEKVQERKKPDRSPGTFFISLKEENDPKGRSKTKKKKDISRKRDRERKRKQRQKQWTGS